MSISLFFVSFVPCAPWAYVVVLVGVVVSPRGVLRVFASLGSVCVCVCVYFLFLVDI